MMLRRLPIVLGAALLLARCGSVISGDLTGDHRPFDFEHPGCVASVTPPSADTVDVRYLGSGGVYIGWGANAILAGPFFSNPSIVQSLFCSMDHDRSRIANRLADVPVQNVRAIVTGHSHYDHIGDVPVVAQEYAAGAAIYVNESGANMLAAYPSLRPRTKAVNEGDVIPIAGADGAEVFRIHAIKSDHAPQVCRSRRWPCDVSNCSLQTPWSTTFESHPLRDFCGGQTLAFVIDLLRGGHVRYRIYYNDAAAEAPLGVPVLADEIPYDLAILCMASYDFVHGYPEAVLKAIHPAHVLIAHYEDFFARTEGHWRFVPLLTNRKARRFIERMRAVNAAGPSRSPTNRVCGATAPDFTMPIVGEQMLFASERRASRARRLAGR